MSQQSGITVSPQLREIFTNCNSRIRMIKMVISKEQIVLAVLNDVISTWTDDWNRLILPCLDSDKPCYVLYRLDSSQSSIFDWVFLSYCPDIAPVKLKMLHASTKATLKRFFGEGKIKFDLFGTSPDDMTLESYYSKMNSQSAPKPLTSYEEDLAEVREQAFRSDVGATTKQSVMKGVSFPITKDGLAALQHFSSGSYNFVVLSVNTQLEEIETDSSGIISSPDELAKCLPLGHARFLLYRYNHSFQGRSSSYIIFVYYVPSDGCPVKERMLYSACKMTLLSRLQELLTADSMITKSIEIDSPAEICTSALNDTLGLAETVKQPVSHAVSRPAPPGRGPRRMIRGSLGH